MGALPPSVEGCQHQLVVDSCWEFLAQLDQPVGRPVTGQSRPQCFLGHASDVQAGPASFLSEIVGDKDVEPSHTHLPNGSAEPQLGGPTSSDHER